MNYRTGITGSLASRWTRKIGSLHLGIAGAGNVAIAVGLGALINAGNLVPLLINTLPTVVDEVELVASARWILTVVVTGSRALTVVLLLVGVFQLYGAWNVYRARRWTLGVSTAVAGGMNPLVSPLALAALVLIWLSRFQFPRGDEE